MADTAAWDEMTRREITSWRRYIPEKLTVVQPVKKFPVFYGTNRFITVFKTSRH
jgi:hypothetical protein